MTTDWLKSRKLLCIRLDNLGDVIMTTPAMRALKESIPGVSLTLLTSQSGAQATALIPQLDDVIIYEAPWMKATSPRRNSAADWKLIERLRRSLFDGALIFTVFSQNPLPAALTAFLADIPLRIAYSRENPYQLLTDWIKEPDSVQQMRHEVRRQLDLVAAIGCSVEDERLGLQVQEKDQLTAIHKLREAGVNLSNPWVVIHPGSTAPSRRYAPQGFAEIAARLTIEDGMQVVFTGDRDEAILVESIQQMTPRSFSLAGQLTLGEMSALLQISPLLISNNTGPMHIAAAVGTPVVALYALTNPQHTPWQVPSRVLNHDVPCKNCFKSICPEGHHNCLQLVKPDRVVQSARDLLRETTSSRTSLMEAPGP